ncbi:MAG: hypothetical protein JWN54_3779 [Mycobacterium sp.]|jgi:hypothetical protein|nr:hypothetical protein [Mycobacterium sp.]
MVTVDPAALDELSRHLVGVRGRLLGARESLTGPGLFVQPVDQAADELADRCQRALIDVAAEVQFVALGLAHAAEVWRRTESAVAGACR